MRLRLSEWLSETALNQHPGNTVANLDRNRWLEAKEATIALEAALEGRDAIGVDVARAALAGLAMFEDHVKGGARPPVDIPMDVLSRRDVSVAASLPAEGPHGRPGALWAN